MTAFKSRGITGQANWGTTGFHPARPVVGAAVGVGLGPVAVMAGAAERELDHMGFARDDAELAAQGRHQRPVLLPRITWQRAARPAERGIPTGGQKVVERTW